MTYLDARELRVLTGYAEHLAHHMGLSPGITPRTAWDELTPAEQNDAAELIEAAACMFELDNTEPRRRTALLRAAATKLRLAPQRVVARDTGSPDEEEHCADADG